MEVGRGRTPGLTHSVQGPPRTAAEPAPHPGRGPTLRIPSRATRCTAGRFTGSRAVTTQRQLGPRTVGWESENGPRVRRSRSALEGTARAGPRLRGGGERAPKTPAAGGGPHEGGRIPIDGKATLRQA